MTQHDRERIRRLAAEVAAIAALPVQEEKKRLWKRLNALRPERPMVMIDQVCWNEMNVDNELTLQCEDRDARYWEWRLLETLYRWRHFPVDMVVESVVRVPMAVTHTGFGIQVEEEIRSLDPTSSVVSHAYQNQFQTEKDIEKIQTPMARHDEAETARRLEVAHHLFDGLLEVVPWGWEPYFSVWDPLSMWMSVGEALTALVDRPDFVLEIVHRMVRGYMALLDQMEQNGWLCGPQPWIHCTGGFTDELPAPGYDPARPRARDIWTFGLAQMLATVSPSMFEEFEIRPCLPFFERFGLVYYGCCDPLHDKIEQVSLIPNVRKISVSPWADEEIAARKIGPRWVYSRKPNPALLAGPSFSEEAVRDHLQRSVEIARRYGCPIELILKDISTVAYQPQRLWRWAEIAMSVVAP